MFCAILVTANGGHLGMPNCENSKRLHTKKHSGTKLDKFQSIVSEILSFSCLCFLVTGPNGHLGQSI